MNGNVNKHRLVLVKISLFEFYLKKRKKKVKNIAKKLSKIVQKSEKLSKTIRLVNHEASSKLHSHLQPTCIDS